VSHHDAPDVERARARIEQGRSPVAEREPSLEELIAAAARGAIADPFPLLRRLRDECPVLPIGDPSGALADGDTPGNVLITRHDDVKSTLKNDEAFSSAIVNRTIGLVMGPTIVGMDGREHLKHRALVTPALAPRALRGDFPALVRRIAHELIDRFSSRGRADLRSEFTFSYPLRVFVEILGLPGEDVDQFHEWAIELTQANVDLPTGMAAAQKMLEYLTPLIERKRKEGGDDLVSRLARAEVDGERLSDLEVVSFLRLLVVAGAETTYHLMGSCLVALLRDPSLMERVRSDRSLVPPLIQEILRWESPIATVAREATEDTEIGGVELGKGTVVMCHIGSANRDERRFADPDLVDIHREDKEHIAFGFGKHYCAGSRLALLEAEVGLGALLDRLPGLGAQAGEPFGVVGFAFRGPDRLPVTFDSGP
jgi:cytochrome P450